MVSRIGHCGSIGVVGDHIAVGPVVNFQQLPEVGLPLVIVDVGGHPVPSLRQFNRLIIAVAGNQHHWLIASQHFVCFECDGLQSFCLKIHHFSCAVAPETEAQRYLL